MELIVVIALILVLSVACFTGYRSMRMRANQVTSTENLRQLAAANLLYAAEHQTYAPASDPSNLIRWHGGRDGIGGKFDPEKGYLSEYLGFSRRVGQCSELARLLTGKAFNEDGSGGYGYNSTYIGGTPPNPFKPNRPDNVTNPARTLMFATTAFAVSEGIQEYPFADPPYAVDANWRVRGSLQPSVHFRFNRKALIAWCDGHVTVESRTDDKGENFYGGSNKSASIGFCGPKRENGWWNPRN